MSFRRLIARSLAHHRRMHAGLLLGATLACGILTGALLVGGSVDHALRSVATARLGRIAFAMDWHGRFFRAALADALKTNDTRIHAAALLEAQGMTRWPAERSNDAAPLNRVHVYGIDPAFAALAESPWTIAPLGPGETALSEATAQALHAKPGDDLELRIAHMSAVPMDAPLASRKDSPFVTRLVTVKAVLSDAQLGRFGLAANQAAPYNVFVDRAWLGTQMQLEGQANVLVADGAPTPEELQRALDGAWNLDDVGLRVRQHPSGVVQIESSRIFLDEEAVRAALEIPGAMPTLTYLVNAIASSGGKTPYSFVEAGPVPAGTPDNGAVISQWLADRIGAKEGSSIEVSYSRLLSSSAFVEERRTLTVSGVVPMESLAAERELAPVFPGLSDVERCSDWDIGMPMDKDLLKDKANEDYWHAYGQTPKLLTTYAAGKAMWGTPFGSVTAIRFSGPDAAAAKIGEALRAKIRPEAIGFRFTPSRELAIAAVNQATDFGGLFTGMSTFLIVAALILLGLLYVFGIQQRASEIGLLLAVGFSRARVRMLLALEACPAAIAGCALGILAGVAYARFLLAGLAWLWPGAVANASVALYIDPAQLCIGGVSGVVCALAVAWGCVWRATRQSVRDLMTTDFASAAPSRVPGKASRWRNYALLLAPTAILVAAAATAVDAWHNHRDALAEPFFSVASLVFLAELGFAWWALRWLASRGSFRRASLAKMALSNLARRRGRSLSIAGLTACGCFLVFAVSAMQENVALHADQRSSGTGGFALFADTTAPILGAPGDVTKTLGAEAVPLKVRDGDDAGCLNLNHAQTPRLFGVDAQRMAALEAFVPRGGGALWALLDKPLADGAVPALVGDSDTAMWGLQKKTGPVDGDTIPYRDESGNEIRIKLVGQLPMRLSVFQGSLLISADAFTRLFPSEAGYRAFLIDAPHDAAPSVAARLDRDFDRYGMAAVPASRRLADFYAVEASYLAMFLVLGGLGLVLGAGGTGVVVLRNVFERHREIAVLNAVGYDAPTVFRVFLAEHLLLVGAGIVLGTVAAGVSILPLVVASQTTVSLGVQAILLAGIAAANVIGVCLGLWFGIPEQPVRFLRSE